MPVINGVYLKDFPALPSSVADANIIPIAISGNQIAYRTTVAGIVTDARVTSKLLTGLSVTGSTILATDTILQAFGKVQNQLNGKVSSVGLTMPAAFNVANSPITSAGTLAVTAAGVASQYIRGDGALADFPTTAGGGSSVSYYLNGSVSQGTFVGNTYYEMNKTPVIGTGTDFTINANGYIAQFITDANDPASLLIPAGNWNVEMYFSASSSGGNPSFYVEVYKYNGTTFTLLGTSSATPEGITNGTAIDIYYTSVGIPETVLTLTDRLAIRVYVTHSGRTITLHTEDNHLSEIVTTFSNGLTTLNGLTKQAQYFAVGSTGTDFAISSSVDTHTFNIPSASATNRGLITTGAQTIAGDKNFTGIINALAIQSNQTSGYAIFTNSITNGFGGYFGVSGTGSHSIYAGAVSGNSIQARNNSSTYETINLINDGSGNIATFGNSSGTKLTVSNLGGLTGTTANFTGQLTLGSTITNGTYTYTLPSATGTLALTSDIHSAVTLSAIGSTPNANGATLTGQVLNLQPASASFGGVVTTGTQTFAGAKTFSGIVNASAGNINIQGANQTSLLLNQNAGGTSTGFLIGRSLSTTDSQDFFIYDVAAASTRFTIASNGAATFSADIAVNTTMTVGRGGGAITTNTALGTNALYSNTTGSLNVALGYQAGFGSLGTNANTTGSNNIFIGYNSVGLSATASNRTWIGNVATTSTWLGGRLLIGSTTDSGNAAIQVTATTLLGLYASATTGIAVQGDSTGTGGTGVFGNSGNGYGGAFANNSTTYPALWVNNNEESAGDIAVFQWIGSSIFTVAPGISTFNTSVIGRSFIPTFSTVPTNGMYLSAANTLNFATNTTNRFSISSTGAATFSSSLLEIAATSPTLRINSTTGGNDGILAWYVNTNYIGDIRTNSGSGAMTFNQGPSAGWGGYMVFKTDTTERMRITSGGNVLINKTTSSGSGRFLDFASSAFSSGADSGYFWEDRSNASNYYGWYTTGNVIYLFNGTANAASISPSTGVYTPLSDINKKKDFEQSEIGLNAILGLKPTLYRMKSDESENEKELGFIAQEVKEFIPQAYVESGEDEDKFIGLNYNAIVAALVKGMQEQQAQIEELKALINK